MTQFAYAARPARQGRPATTTDPGAGDWLTMPESELEAMHAEAMALYLGPRSGGPLAARNAAGLALLHQLLIARGIVRAGRQDEAGARAAMRSDRALGYLFGLASGGPDPADTPRHERRIASTLMMLHDLLHGREVAETLTGELVAGGSKAVGEGFAEGILSATADLAALRRWRRGAGGGLPGGLLDGLHWPGLVGHGSGDARH